MDASWFHVLFAAVVFFTGGFVLASIMVAGAQADIEADQIRRRTVEDMTRESQR